MRLFRSHRVGWAGAGLGLVVLLTVGLASPLSPTVADSHPAAPHSASDYLALGDSVTFGYREQANLPAPDYSDGSSFVGYPEDVGAALGLNVANAACPGETSTSLIEPNVVSNGCENSPGGGPGYRTLYPLHVSYSGTQLQYALRFLRTHPHTELVSLMIGANDGFLCQATTPDHCATELPAVLKQISSNVADILWSIRHEARYQRQIVIVNYYSLDYANATDNASGEVLNQAVDGAAQPFNVRIADGFSVFQNAALQASGSTCQAGLLTQLTTGGCGIHPSVAGQALLASAVEDAIRS
jgi:lysophospholipase L1-like esterase